MSPFVCSDGGVRAATSEHDRALLLRLAREAIAAQVGPAPAHVASHTRRERSQPPEAYVGERWAVAAARAGKHIVLEKPTGLDTRELAAIRDAVRKARVRTIVSFELHYNPYIRFVHWLREAGWLAGTVTVGQAFGGDLETVTVHTGLLAARHVLGAQVTVVAQGPGGALALAGIATACVVAMWFAFYLFVFLSRGALQ